MKTPLPSPSHRNLERANPDPRLLSHANKKGITIGPQQSAIHTVVEGIPQPAGTLGCYNSRAIGLNRLINTREAVSALFA